MISPSDKYFYLFVIGFVVWAIVVGTIYLRIISQPTKQDRFIHILVFIILAPLLLVVPDTLTGLHKAMLLFAPALLVIGLIVLQDMQCKKLDREWYATIMEPEEKTEELETRLAVLRVVRNALEDRVCEDPNGRWYWECNLKLVTYFLSRLQAGLEGREDRQYITLTEEERQEIEANHPLLDQNVAKPPPGGLHEGSPWFNDMRARIHRYAVTYKRDTA